MARDGFTEKQQFWFDHIESCASLGVTMRAYSEQHGLDLQNFYYWKKHLKALGFLSENGLKAGRCRRATKRPQACALAQPPAPFLRASLIPTEAKPPSESEVRALPCGARISLANGITIAVPAGIAPDALGALIVAAQQIPGSKDGSQS